MAAKAAIIINSHRCPARLLPRHTRYTCYRGTSRCTLITGGMSKEEVTAYTECFISGAASCDWCANVPSPGWKPGNQGSGGVGAWAAARGLTPRVFRFFRQHMGWVAWEPVSVATTTTPSGESNKEEMGSAARLEIEEP